jgi:sulfite oxidase
MSLSRYGKRADLIVHEEEPFNAESGLAALAEGPLTATDAFYVRGHGAVPEVDPAAWRLRVRGLVERELELSLTTLREAFPERVETATLQCAGNRRAGLMAVRDIPGEAPWGAGATGTASWSGVALADVLALAGPLREGAHVGFVGADLCPEARPAERFGGSIPLDKACRPEVLLAWAMNGEPLAPVHGAPLRVVVPGYIGARSVKWLERIEVRSAPWEGYFQQVVYRLLPEDGTPGPGAGMPLGLVALNADVLSPADGDTVPAGPVEVRGYAFAGGERHVSRVDVSLDGGANWSQAELLEDLGRWAWRHWRITVELAPGEHEILVRAWDSSAATQPNDEAALWNPGGYVNNARPRCAPPHSRCRCRPCVNCHWTRSWSGPARSASCWPPSFGGMAPTAASWTERPPPPTSPRLSSSTPARSSISISSRSSRSSSSAGPRCTACRSSRAAAASRSSGSTGSTRATRSCWTSRRAPRSDCSAIT